MNRSDVSNRKYILIVFVTGAGGFLGSHLVDSLIADGDRVLGIDNFVTGSRENLVRLAAERAFSLIEADVSLPWTWAREGDKPDLIMHFASPASPVDYGREPLATMAVNALGVMHGVALAHATGARLLFASTSETYVFFSVARRSNACVTRATAF